MSEQKIDGGKRTWIIASSCMGAVGAGFVREDDLALFVPVAPLRIAAVAANGKVMMLLLAVHMDVKRKVFAGREKVNLLFK